MREEIIVGMRNALERGESIERAVQTFINAGYNPFEVRAAAQMISGYNNASTPIANPQSAPVQYQTPQQPPIIQFQSQEPEKKSGKTILIIGIAISTLILLSAISYLAFALLSKP